MDNNVVGRITACPFISSPQGTTREVVDWSRAIRCMKACKNIPKPDGICYLLEFTRHAAKVLPDDSFIVKRARDALARCGITAGEGEGDE